MITQNQKVVLNYLRTKENATLEECYQNSNQSYYLNWQKHMGDFMSRLIKQGYVERVKKGVFKIKTKQHNEKQKEIQF